MESPATSLLELHDLSKCFPLESQSVDVLDGISFTAYAGEFITLMGKSGSGKSTLLNVMSGLEEPSAGGVTLCGRDLYQLKDSHDHIFLKVFLKYLAIS